MRKEGLNISRLWPILKTTFAGFISWITHLPKSLASWWGKSKTSSTTSRDSDYFKPFHVYRNRHMQDVDFYLIRITQESFNYHEWCGYWINRHSHALISFDDLQVPVQTYDQWDDLGHYSSLQQLRRATPSKTSETQNATSLVDSLGTSWVVSKADSAFARTKNHTNA